MMRLSRFLALALVLIIWTTAAAQDHDSLRVRKGWNIGALPDVAYETDLGFKYGAIVNFFYYGDGKVYPRYYHFIYAEAARTTTNYNLFRLSYDSKYLIPDHRFSVDLTYISDQLFDFYGFNGLRSLYHPEWTDPDNPLYISRAYYKLHSNMFRFAADIQGEINGPLNWNAGLGILDYRLSSVDIDRLNRRKDDDDMLPDTATLYDKYLQWGLINADEGKGGFHPYLHAGVTYDTRDRLQNPPRGIYADAFLSWFGAFGDLKGYNHLTANITWRQYIPLLPDRLTLAYRLGTQLTLAGKSTFYLNTYLNQLYLQRVVYEGLGGGNSCRGMLRNRINADGFAFGSIEMRLRLFDFRVKKENFTVAINPFMDAGMVLQEHEAELGSATGWEDDINPNGDLYKPHFTAGCGLKLAMNVNFVVSIDWAKALDKQDSPKGGSLYIKLGYQF